MKPAAAGAVAGQFIEAFSAVDFARMGALLSDDLVAYITNADGGIDEVRGRDGYLDRLRAMDLPSARFSVHPTQPPVVVDGDLVLLMVEIRAERGGRTLHNYAAHLLRIPDGQISEWHMADAKPAESDAFWS